MSTKNTANNSTRNSRDNNGRLIRFSAAAVASVNRNARDNNGRLIRFN